MFAFPLFAVWNMWKGGAAAAVRDVLVEASIITISYLDLKVWEEKYINGNLYLGIATETCFMEIAYPVPCTAPCSN